MGFQIYSIDDDRVAGIEYLPCSAITPTKGLALTQEGGLLVKATGATMPRYIAAVGYGSACSAGAVIPVVRVNRDMIFETTFAVSASGIKPGDRVTLHTDAEQVTAATSGGVAEVVYMDGMDAGSMCRVRFVDGDGEEEEADRGWITLAQELMTDRDGNVLYFKPEK